MLALDNVRSSSAGIFVFVAVLCAVTACSAVLGLPDRVLDTESPADGRTAPTSPSDAGSIDGAINDGDPPSACPTGLVTCEGDALLCTTEVASFQTDVKNCGACRHDCLGGSCLGGTCGVVRLATGQNTPVHLAVDNDAVYWVTSAGNSAARISACPRTGACPSTPPSFGPGTPVSALAGSKTRIYWSNGGSPSRIITCDKPFPCGPGVDLATLTNVGTDFIVDEKGGRLFFISAGNVRKCSLTTPCTPELVATSTAARALTYDGTSLFWASGSTVQTCIGSVCAAEQMVATSSFMVSTLSVDDANTVYFGSNNKVRFGPKTPGSATTAFADGDGPAAYGGMVYWASGTALQSCAGAAPCAKPTIMTVAAAAISELRVDAAAVYFIVGKDIFRVAR